MEPYDIRLLALDLDGTLTNSQKEISGKNKIALYQAEKQGVRVALASGRPALGIRRLADELWLSKRRGFIMAYNGGEIVDCETGKIIFRKTLKRELVPEICALGRELGLHLISYNDNEIISERPDGHYVQKEAFCCRTKICKAERLEEALEQDPVKFIAADEPDFLREVLPIFRERFGGDVNLFFSEPYFMEIVPKEIEKSFGLSRIAEYLGITKDQIMAMGDGYNDIPMMQYAGLSVAMKNGCRETREAADFVTVTNDEDGVAQAIEHFILGKEKHA